jgi:hypothetical protein
MWNVSGAWLPLLFSVAGPSPSLGSARLCSALLGSARLCSVRLCSALLGSARLGSALLGSAWLGSIRLGSTRRSEHVRPLSGLLHAENRAEGIHSVG